MSATTSINLGESLRFFSVFFVFLGLTACGSSDQSVSDLQQHIHISQTAQSTADTRVVFATLKDVSESNEGKGQIAADQLFSILAMKRTERQKLATAYPNPLNIDCTEGFCQVSGRGHAVTAQTEVTGGGINRPVLGLGLHLTGSFIFTSTGLLRACGLTGVTVRKFIITKQVQGVEIQVRESGVRTIVDAGDDHDNFDCRRG